MASARQDLASYIAAQPAASRSQLAKSIAAHLIATKQVDQLENLIRDIQSIKETSGTVEATVTSAHPLDTSMLDEVKAILKHHKPAAKHIQLDTAQDPSVIGGVNIRLANEQLNLTVRSKLDTFKRLTTEGTH